MTSMTEMDLIEAQKASFFKLVPPLATLEAHRDSPNDRIKDILHPIYFDPAQKCRLGKYLGLKQPEEKTLEDLLFTPCESKRKQEFLRTIRLFAHGFINAVTTARYLDNYCQQRKTEISRIFNRQQFANLAAFVETFKFCCLKQAITGHQEKPGVRARKLPSRSPRLLHASRNLVQEREGLELRSLFREVS